MGWLSDTWDTVKGAASAAGDAVRKFADDPAGHIKSAATFVKETAEYVADKPARAAQIAAKGAVQGVSSVTGMVGDLGMAVYNRGIRHGLNALGADLDKSDFSCSKWVENRIYDVPGLGSLKTIEAQNDYERAILYTTQGVVEVGAFVAISAATAGTAGAALGAIRGGSIAARGLSVAGKTGRILSPFASKTAFAIEAGAAGYSIKNNFNKGGRQAEAASELVSENLATSTREKVSEISAENTALLQQLGIDPNNVTIEALRDAGVPVDEMPKSALESLGINFSAENNMESSHRTVTSDLTRSGQGGKLSNNFANATSEAEIKDQSQPAVKPVMDLGR